MARALFGGTADDFVYTTAAGGLMRAMAATVTIWSAKTGGVQLTDLLLDGNPITQITVGVDGQIPEFSGPDAVYEVWASANSGSRIKLSPATSDARNAADIANPASATAGALSATYAPLTLLAANYSPEKYGAVGDGISDDSTAIQAMYDAVKASGKPGLVVFKPKTYLTSKEIQVKSDDTVTLAYGATILGTVTPTDNGGLVTIVDRSDATHIIKRVQWHGGTFKPRHALDNGLSIASVEDVIVTDVFIDMTVAANRGIAIQTANPYGPIRRVAIADCVAWGANGVDAYNLNANLTGAATDVQDVSFTNCAAFDAGMGLRIGCSSVGQTMSRITVDGLTINNCASGVQLNDLNDSALINFRIAGVTGSSGAIGRAINARYLARCRVANGHIYGPGAGNMAIAFVNGGIDCELSSVHIEGTFTVGIYNGGTVGSGVLTARNIAMKGLTTGISTTAAGQQAVYDGFTFDNVTTQVDTYRADDLYTSFATRSGSTIAGSASQQTRWTGDVNGTAWTLPARWTRLRIRGQAAGSGGGSGRRGAAGTVRCGGGGGAGGAYSDRWVTPADLAGTSTLYIYSGTGGAGGAAQTVDSTDGNAGSAGQRATRVSKSNSVFDQNNLLIEAQHATVAGGGGTATAGTAGAAGVGGFPGGAGGAASASGGAGGGGATTTNSAPGGGAGGGITSADAHSAGGTGIGLRSGGLVTGPTAGTAGGGNGGAGLAVNFGYFSGSSGAGGGGNTGGAGGAGGTATYGAGGGGGGAALNGANSGAGGAGGDGWVEITAYFD